MPHNHIPTYSAENLKKVTNLPLVRLRANQFLPDADIRGQVHLVGELLDNSTDELLIRVLAGLSALVEVVVLWDDDQKHYQIIVRDNGRGIPVAVMKDVYSELNFSGKFDQDAYQFSGGQFGVGATVVAGLSRRLRALTDRLNGRGSYCVFDGIADEAPIVDSVVPTVTGTTVIYEPDPQFLDNSDQFDTRGIDALTLRLKKLAYFSKIRIVLRRGTEFIPEGFWTAQIDDAHRALEHAIFHSEILFDSTEYDRENFIREYWKIYRPLAWKLSLEKPLTGPKDKLAFTAQICYAKFTEGTRYFGMVNNVPIDDDKSHHMTVVLDLLREHLAPKIENKEHRAFFLKTYRIPVCLAVNLLYSGAQLSSTVKDGFRDKTFSEIYRNLLRDQFAYPEMKAALGELYEQLAQDIIDKYNSQLGNITKTKDVNKLFLDLKRPSKYHRCGSTDPKVAELLVMEGDSAGGESTGDSAYQAIYSIQGKTFNAISKVPYKTIGASIQKVRAKLMEDDIFHDLIKLLGINPNKFDPADLNFARLILCVDGD